MLLNHLPAPLSIAFKNLAKWLRKDPAAFLPLILLGALFAKGRRTVTSWFHPVGILKRFHSGYTAISGTGRNSQDMAPSVLKAIEPCLDSKRLVASIDDTPTPRYGPEVEGAGIHRNPTPGPAGSARLYGHVWVTLAVLALHPLFNTIALPLHSHLYVRNCDIAGLDKARTRLFRTKLELAVDQLEWLQSWAQQRFSEYWVVVDGAYAKRVFLKGAREFNFTVISRLRKDAALWSLPKLKKKGQHGPQATYGKEKISLAVLAGQSDGWEQVECVQYGKKVTKTIKTFLATYKVAGGLIRVVIVKEEKGSRSR